jgi:hypothetical protein
MRVILGKNPTYVSHELFQLLAHVHAKDCYPFSKDMVLYRETKENPALMKLLSYPPRAPRLCGDGAGCLSG